MAIASSLSRIAEKLPEQSRVTLTSCGRYHAVALQAILFLAPAAAAATVAGGSTQPTRLSYSLSTISLPPQSMSCCNAGPLFHHLFLSSSLTQSRLPRLPHCHAFSFFICDRSQLFSCTSCPSCLLSFWLRCRSYKSTAFRHRK
jgi:hypothetical protein